METVSQTQNLEVVHSVPPSGGSLEIGNKEADKPLAEVYQPSSPFGGIPRNWKLEEGFVAFSFYIPVVPPSGGSLEIGNFVSLSLYFYRRVLKFPLRGDP